jgi:hypothetical protein
VSAADTFGQPAVATRVVTIDHSASIDLRSSF